MLEKKLVKMFTADRKCQQKPRPKHLVAVLVASKTWRPSAALEVNFKQDSLEEKRNSCTLDST